MIDNKVTISDGPYAAYKGSMFLSKANTLTKPLSPNFYRYPNTSEKKSFKQLINYGLFNQYYRRFYKIEGDYRSFVYNTASNQNLRSIVGFHKTYTYKDFEPDLQYILIPPLEIDVYKGNIKANLLEVKKTSSDGTQVGNVDKLCYDF